MRNDFHAQIDEVVDQLVATAEVADEMLDRALDALVGQDVALAEQVIERDNVVDAEYADTQQAILRLLALQAPVASDLRLLSSMLHVNIHVERLGDYATSVAKMAELSSELTDAPDLAEQLTEMGRAARDVGQDAMRSFATRDVDLARALPARDDRVDKLNIGIFTRLVELAAEDRSRLEWATHMILVARLLERYGDHAVDIGEQTIFAVTGTTVELSSNDPHADIA